MNETISNNVNKFRNSYKDILGNVSNFYDDVKEQYEKLLIVPTGNQIYTVRESIELDIRKDENLKLTSKITDYTTENNKNLQSNISLAPIEITLTGIVGEKVYKKENKNKIQKFLEEKLIPLDNFTKSWNNVKLNEFLRKTQEIQNKVDKYINKVGDGIGYIKNIFNFNELGSRQKTIVSQLFSLWGTRTLVNLQTDFIVLENMAIQDIDISNTEISKDFINVSISFKQITYFQLEFKKKGKTATSREKISKNGKTNGLKSMWKKGVDIVTGGK